MKTKVVFICLGNICRSPAAQAVFQSMVNRRDLNSQIEVDSCGTSGYHEGEKADARMIKAAKSRGIEVTSLSRKFQKSDFRKFDYLIVMDDANLENIKALDLSNEYTAKIHKMTDFCSSKFNEYNKVPDPYYGGENGFELVLDLLEDSCEKLLNDIIDNNI